eukprot:1928083-Amphidinium_carterae.1
MEFLTARGAPQAWCRAQHVELSKKLTGVHRKGEPSMVGGTAHRLLAMGSHCPNKNAKRLSGGRA